MSAALPEFDFVKTAACRDPKATNVPGIVALRDSVRPDIVITYTAAEWADLTAAIKGGEYDLSA
ncbi:DUF397 domain-containing protein [Streptomyces sp. L2]|uniref:DUF397 domain-containing protein n=1 Tax=Streptomyces sp. L2 TaxID=2162665 RepID=UPI0010106B09|nr:DUF397 domain-containing protein [Streptomyces sp. L2]